MAPTDLPPRQTGPAAWLPSAGVQKSVVLTDAQVRELVDAANSVVEASELVETGPVSLPALAATMESARFELLHGSGYVVFSGLPVAELAPMAQAAAFMIIGRHLGRPRMQNAAGDLLGHVRDVGLQSNDPTVRIYQTNERQTFHTDSTDVVGLCCLHPAAEGGDSLLASALSIYNEMAAHRPDLATELFAPVATDRRGEIPDGALPYFTIPPLTWFDNRLAVIYQRQYIDSARRFDDVAPLDPLRREALDMFDRLADELSISMRLEQGDLQFVNNHVLLHDRTAFTNAPGEPDRHLLRLWLSMPGDQALDPVYAQRYGSVEIGNRGGIAVAGVTPRVVV